MELKKSFAATAAAPTAAVRVVVNSLSLWVFAAVYIAFNSRVNPRSRGPRALPAKDRQRGQITLSRRSKTKLQQKK